VLYVIMCDVLLYCIVLYCTVLYRPLFHCSTMPPGTNPYAVNNNNNNNNNIYSKLISKPMSNVNF